jgi:transcriptional regulator with XRE-family HTH domain
VAHRYQMLLKQAREERGWSQKDVAHKIGTDPKTVSRWERSVAYPSPYFRQKLSELFEKNLRDLDLLNPGGRASEDGDPSNAKHATGLLERLEKPSDGPPDKMGQQRDRVVVATEASGQQTHAIALHRQNRKRMLERLDHAYAELLGHSLQEIAWIELGLAGIPDAVQNAANRLLRLTQQHEQVLPAGTSILEVYEASERELLILGEPGAGKSTLLLRLAQALVYQAEQEEAQPLPVVLSLSSWAEHKPALEDWMSDQLALTYDVSPKLSTQWVRSERMLPLLDGLDEMDTTSRVDCISAINAYHREHLLVPLVICSRRAEYEDAARHQKLALQQAILIQPLTLEQVFVALDQVGQPLDTLRQTLQTNQALRELSTTPLMVSILMLTYSRSPLPTLSNEVTALQEQVWSDYVARMTEQKGDSGRYPYAPTCSWLNWLARNLQKHYEAVFYLEHVQTDWLPEGLRQHAFQLTMRLPIVLLGVLSSIVLGLFLQTVFDLTTGIQAAILGGFLGGCLSHGGEAGTPGETGMRPRRRTLKRGLIAAGTGLAIGLSFAGELGPGYRLAAWVRDGLIYGSILGLACWALLVVLPRVSSWRGPSSGHRVAVPLHHLFSPLHLRRALLVAGGLGFAYGLSTALSYGPGYGPSAGLNIGLSYAGVTLLLSVIIENYTRDLRLTERLRWSWSGFWQRLRSLEHCLTSAGLALAVLLIVGLSYGLAIGLGLQVSTQLGFRLSYGLSDGLGTGLGAGSGAGLANGLLMGLIVGVGTGAAYWLALGLFQSITQEQLEDQDRQRFNQGMRRSALNSAIIGLLSGGIIAGIGFLGYWLSYALNEGLSRGLGAALGEGLSKGLGPALGVVWLFAIAGGVVGWAVSGGWAVLRHMVLRWVLSRGRVFPWHAQAFLDDAAARILVRRDGGGYSFMHRLLLEYFAQLGDGHAPGERQHIET